MPTSAWASLWRPPGSVTRKRCLPSRGDHWSRRCLNPRPSIFERKAVPFVLYGPDILKPVSHEHKIYGSHLDIIPTLVEMVAPNGFSYHAFGRNMMAADSTGFSYGNNTVIGPNFLLEINPPAGPESLTGQAVTVPVSAGELREKYQQFHALGWRRVMRGNLF